MISPINPSSNAYPNLEQATIRQAYVQLAELVKNQESVIRQQYVQISKIEMELKELKDNSNRRREKQLFQIFKGKYDIEYKKRTDFEKDVRKLSGQMQHKITEIGKTLFKCMASDSTELSLPLDNSDSSIPPSKFLFSSEFSQIGNAPNAILAKTVDLGDVTPVDSQALLAQLSNKLSHMEAIVEIVFLRLDKYTLEHRNIQKLINGEKKPLEEQLTRLKITVAAEREEKGKLKKMIEQNENDKEKWRKGLKSAKNEKNIEILMGYDKERLIQEIIKATYCIVNLKSGR